MISKLVQILHIPNSFLRTASNKPTFVAVRPSQNLSFVTIIFLQVRSCDIKPCRPKVFYWFLCTHDKLSLMFAPNNASMIYWANDLFLLKAFHPFKAKRNRRNSGVIEFPVKNAGPDTNVGLLLDVTIWIPVWLMIAQPMTLIRL